MPNQQHSKHLATTKEKEEKIINQMAHHPQDQTDQ